jgi:hypothetical protein
MSQQASYRQRRHRRRHCRCGEYLLRDQRPAPLTVLDASEREEGRWPGSRAQINAHERTPRAYYDLNGCSLDTSGRSARELETDIRLTCGGKLGWAAKRVE